MAKKQDRAPIDESEIIRTSTAIARAHDAIIAVNTADDLNNSVNELLALVKQVEPSRKGKDFPIEVTSIEELREKIKDILPITEEAKKSMGAGIRSKEAGAEKAAAKKNIDAITAVEAQIKEKQTNFNEIELLLGRNFVNSAYIISKATTVKEINSAMPSLAAVRSPILSAPASTAARIFYGSNKSMTGAALNAAKKYLAKAAQNEAIKFKKKMNEI